MKISSKDNSRKYRIPIYWRNLMSETPPLVSLMPLIKSKVWIRMRISSLSLPTILSATIRLIWTTSRRGYLLSRNKRDCSRSASLLHVPRQNTDTFRWNRKTIHKKYHRSRLSPKSPTKNWPICFSIPMSFCGMQVFLSGVFRISSRNSRPICSICTPFSIRNVNWIPRPNLLSSRVYTGNATMYRSMSVLWKNHNMFMY